jgi:hypothetical protein
VTRNTKLGRVFGPNRAAEVIGIHIGYWWKSQKERDHYEDQNISGN